MTQPSLPELARRLHALAPDAFTAERGAAAAALRAEGRDADAAIAAGMRKPVASAWALNRLAAEDPDPLTDLAAVGAELRAAQSSGDRVALRAATVARRTALAAALRAVRDLAASAGQPLGATVLDQVEQTLQAAAVDPGAAAAVRSGMLVRPLTPAGLDAVDLDGATALPVDVPGIESAVRGRRGAGDERRRALEEAEAALARAERELERAEAKLTAAETARERLDRDREDLRRRLAALDRERREADRDVGARGAAVDAADDAVDAARDAVRAARRAAPSDG